MQLPEWFRSPILAWVTLAFLSAFALTALLVALMIRVCRTRGWVSMPREDRWHKGTPAFYGGVPLFAGFTAVSLAFIPWSDHLLWRLIGVASLMFALGLVDDIRRLVPVRKLAAQLLAAGLLISSGVLYPLRPSLAVNIVVSVIWLVGITNAFNLLDNMDGLSAGVALIAAAYLTTFYAIGGHRDQAVLSALAAGAIAGFLRFNFKPAQIFMGDSGSLFIGFLLGATSLLGVTHVAGVATFVLAPVMVLAIPIFDTLFVSVTRRLRGQPISQGGTDHSSHRLVRLGLQEGRAVLLLYALSAGSGAVALFARRWFTLAPGLIGLWLFFLLLFGIHLFRDEVTPDRRRHVSVKPGLRRFLSRDTLVFLLDPVALLLSYYIAAAVRFGGEIPSADKTLLVRALPIVMILKLLSLGMCRAFRQSWWRGSAGDFYRLGSAALIGEALSVLAVTGLYRFNGYSRTVFLLDAMIAWGLLFAVRRSFSLFRDTIHNWRTAAAAPRRVFILGTSGHAELALRFLRDRSIECAGFIDTNGGADLRRHVFGRPVLGRLDDLALLARRYEIFEVVLPESEEIPFTGPEFQSFCRHRQLQLTKLGLYCDGHDVAKTETGKAMAAGGAGK
jgi:UDP-GlcNAc:undecaprenyl-phosphate/decaprenyl-phosphate GlcNAc-1-phosphate transferase